MIQHRSKEYADRMLVAIKGKQSIDETKVRDIMFDCYVDAFNRGREVEMKQHPTKEDMGR